MIFINSYVKKSFLYLCPHYIVEPYLLYNTKLKNLKNFMNKFIKIEEFSTEENKYDLFVIYIFLSMT